MRKGGFSIKPPVDLEKVKQFAAGANEESGAGPADAAAPRPVAQPTPTAREPKTQVPLRLAPTVQRRIATLAALKTAETGGHQQIRNQTIMEMAILEYLEREEGKYPQM